MSLTTPTAGLRALGIGDAFVDLTTYAPQLPPVGGNIWSTAPTTSAGGTTNNVAAGLALLGIESFFAGPIGTDPYGQYLVSQMQRLGVDTRGVIRKPDAYTPLVLTVVNDAGERTFFACAKNASHSQLTQEDVLRIDFDVANTVHSTGVCLGEMPSRESLLTALSIAKARGKTLYFDPNLRLEGNIFHDALREAEWKAMQLADVVLLSEEELSMLCPTDSVDEATKILLAAGSNVVVVKRGARGAAVYTREDRFEVGGFGVAVVSTAGAGDAFDAGFIAARLRGAGLEDAGVYANAVAAIKVTRETSQAVPTHPEVMAFLRERGITVRLKA